VVASGPLLSPVASCDISGIGLRTSVTSSRHSVVVMIM